MANDSDKEHAALLWGIGIAIAFLLFISISKLFSSPAPSHLPLLDIIRQKELIAQARFDLLESIAYEKNAVMALTPESAHANAEESRKASHRVDQGLKQLQALAVSTPIPGEAERLAEIRTCWTNLRSLDTVILDLAEQNTNYQAKLLSRSKGAEAVRHLEQALDETQWTQRPVADREASAILRSRTMVAALNLLVLHSPHIDEPSEEGMTGLETQMHDDGKRAGSSLTDLDALVRDQTGHDLVAQARAALAELQSATEIVIDLSRKNSNIKSLDLSLGRKRSVAALCSQAFKSLQETMDQATFRATR